MSNEEKKDENYLFYSIFIRSKRRYPRLVHFFNTTSCSIIFSFLRTMDIDRICEELTGKKTPQELIEILFYFDQDLY